MEFVGETGELACGTDKARLEQFIALGKNAKGAAARDLIMQATRAPDLYVFGELLGFPGIEALGQSDADEHSRKHHALLTLFAYGTYSDYVGNEPNFPPLDDEMLLKLRQLSIVSAAAASHRQLPYDELMKLTGVSSVRQLEDIIIHAIYAGVLRGRLDQRQCCFDIEGAAPRDVRPDQLSTVIQVLDQFADGCDRMLEDLATQMLLSDERRALGVENKQRLAVELGDLVKSIEAAAAARSDTPEFVLSEATPSEGTAAAAPAAQRRRGPAKRAGQPPAGNSAASSSRGSSTGRMGVFGKM